MIGIWNCKYPSFKIWLGIYHMVKGVHIPWNHWWAHFNNDKKMQLSGLTAKSPLPITTKKLSIFLNHVFCSRLAADSDKTPSDDTLLWENLQVVFVMLVVVVFVTGGFYVSELLFLATGTPPWLPRPVKASTSSELYPGYLWLLYFCQVRYGFEVEFFTHRHF